METGWDVHFKRVKTGPMAYNVEYQLQALKCKSRPLDEKEMELANILGLMVTHMMVIGKKDLLMELVNIVG